MNDENSLIHRIRKIGDSYIFEILANIEAPLGPISDDTADIDVTLEVPQSTIPAADRIVTKNDNQPEFDEAITAVEDVIAELEKDSSLDNILGDEKGPLISVLKAGRDLFETGRINVSVGIMYNLEPLKNFVERYKDQIVNATINGVITTAILALSTLFGIL